MARKTLNQILKQNTFTGADVGKAILLNSVSFLESGKYAIDDNTLDIMINSIQTYSQRTVYQAYKDFATYLITFRNMAEGNSQQCWHGIEHILLLLAMAHQNQNRYIDYLEQPLVIKAADYSAYREKAEAEMYGAKYSLKDIEGLLIVAAIKAYKKKKELAPELDFLKNILAKYEKEPAEVIRHDTFVSLDNKTLIATYAKFHNVHNDMSSLLDFVLDKYNTDYDGEKILPTEKVSAASQAIIETLREIKDSSFTSKEAEKLLANLIRQEIHAAIGKVNRANMKIAYYLDNEGGATEPVEELIEKRNQMAQLFTDLSPATTEKTTKLDKLSEVLWADDGIADIKPVVAATELLEDTKEVRKAFPEVFMAAENLASKLTPASKAGKYSLKALEALGLDPSELLDLPAATEHIIADSYSKANKKDLTCRTKAIKGGVATAPEGKEPPKIPKWVLDFDILNLSTREDIFNKATTDKPQKTIDRDMVKVHIDQLIIPALRTMNGINAILDTYSNLLKVDLTPLKTDLSNIERRISAYNDLLYLLYMEADNTLCADTKKTYTIIEQQKATIKDTFPTINPADYRLDPKMVKALEAKLENLPIKECVNNKYFGQFLTGGGIIIE